VKLTKISRRLGLLLACVLAVTPAYGMGGGGDSPKAPTASTKGPMVGTDEARRSTPPQQDRQQDRSTTSDQGLPPVIETRGGDRPVFEEPLPSAEMRDRSRFSDLDRDVDAMRRRSADLRKETNDLKDLRTRDPVAYENRVREEHRKLDERARTRANGNAGLDDSLRAIADDIDRHDGDTRTAPELSRDTPRTPTETRRDTRTPVRDSVRDRASRDSRFGRRADAPTRVGDVPNLGTSVPLGGAPAPTTSMDLPWWQVFLNKLIEICGKGLSLLMGRKFGELDQTREEIVNREAGNDPARRAAVDARLRGAMSDGYGLGGPDAPMTRSPTSPDMGRAPVTVGDTRRAPISADAGLTPPMDMRGRSPVGTTIDALPLAGLDGN
jgi:hypothetical protein